MEKNCIENINKENEDVYQLNETTSTTKNKTQDENFEENSNIGFNNKEINGVEGNSKEIYDNPVESVMLDQNITPINDQEILHKEQNSIKQEKENIKNIFRNDTNNYIVNETESIKLEENKQGIFNNLDSILQNMPGDNLEIPDERPLTKDQNIESTNTIPESKQIKEFTFDDIQKPNPFDSSPSRRQKNIINKTKNQEIPEKFEGWLYKKSPNYFVGWQKRYALVDDLTLWYFESPDNLKPNGWLDFRHVIIRIEASLNKPEFTLRIQGNSKVFYFKCDKNSQKDDWINNINKHLSHPMAKKHTSNLEFFNWDNWWRTPQLTEEDFIKRVDSGDILQFQSKNITAKLQRGFTGATYDHVALLLRYNNNELVLLESTGVLGVSLCRWSLFMKNNWHLLYQKLIWRKQHFKRRQKFVENLETFIRKSVGKKYDLSAKKQFNTESSREENIDDKDRGYFCSEQIAAAYKQLGQLPDKKNSSQYWPGDFGQVKMQHQNNGGKLGPEYRINFEL